MDVGGEVAGYGNLLNISKALWVWLVFFLINNLIIIQLWMLFSIFLLGLRNNGCCT